MASAGLLCFYLLSAFLRSIDLIELMLTVVFETAVADGRCIVAARLVHFAQLVVGIGEYDLCSMELTAKIDRPFSRLNRRAETADTKMSL